MREIEFRGKRKDNGEWVRGMLIPHCLFTDKDPDYLVDYWIANGHEDVCFPVITKTVGQYTGLTDKNKAKIFEGDIVRRLYGVNYTSKRHPSFKNNTAKINIAVIEYDIENGGYSYLSSPGDYNFQCEYEVIGNIYDNDIDALTHKYCKNEPDFSDLNDPF